MSNIKFTLVTIVSPETTREQLICITLASSLTQTYPNFEQIIILPEANSSLLEELDRLAIVDNRIRIFIEEVYNYGRHFNLAVLEATGDYIGIVNPNDSIDSTFLANMVKIVQQTKSPVIKGNCAISYNGVIKGTSSKDIPKIDKYPYTFISQPYTAIYNRDFLIENQISWSMNEDTEGLLFLTKVGVFNDIIATAPKIFYYKKLGKEITSLAAKKQALKFILMNRIHISSDHLISVITEIFARQIKEDKESGEKNLIQLLHIIDAFTARKVAASSIIPFSRVYSRLTEIFSSFSLQEIRSMK